MILQDKLYRELRCKNDKCRKLICYEYVMAGRIAYICPRCDVLSVFNFKYLKSKENIDTMDKEFDILKGGEN